MTQDNTGGPAFPVLVSKNPAIEYCDSGMTLRDYCVIHYTSAMLSHATRYKPRPQDAELHWHEAITKEAFELADAMLKAREVSE